MLGDRLLQLRKSRKLSQSEVSAMINVNQVTYSRYERDEREPDFGTLAKLSQVFGVSTDYLLGRTDEACITEHLPNGLIPIDKMPHHYVPLIGAVAAGVPIYMEHNYDVYIDSPRKADFALTIEGDSMSPTYLDGDVVYIKSLPDVDDGQIAVVAVDDSCTIKHVYHTKHGIQLISDNPLYPPMTYTQENSDTIRILGIVVGFTRMYK